jgi:hypothetical protein
MIWCPPVLIHRNTLAINASVDDTVSLVATADTN